MYTQVEKPKENKSRAVANLVTQRKNITQQSFGFVDNRSETVTPCKPRKIICKQSSSIGSNITDSPSASIIQRMLYINDELTSSGQIVNISQRPNDLEKEFSDISLDRKFEIMGDIRKLMLDNTRHDFMSWKKLVDSMKQPKERVGQKAKDLNQILWIGPDGNLLFAEALKHWSKYSSSIREKIHASKQSIFDEIENKIKPLAGGDIDDNARTLLRQVNELINTTGKSNEAWSIDLGNQFLQWLTEGTLPTHANCWEAVMIACEQAGLVDRNEMKNYATTKNDQGTFPPSEHVFLKFILKRPHESIEDPTEADPKIPTKSMAFEHVSKGSVLCFWDNGTLGHVAIYEGHGMCMSIWEAHSLEFELIRVTDVASLIDGCIIEVIT